jgi:glycine betaine/proline transport system substrate-binding protein
LAQLGQDWYQTNLRPNLPVDLYTVHIVLGDVEEIHTIVRQGLKEDQADAYNIIDQFNWEPEDMQAVMLAISEGKTPRQSARDWIELNPDKVKEWLD